MHMITNSEVLRDQLSLHDLKRISKKIMQETTDKLYMLNYINEEEYQKLCQNQK